MGYAIFRDKRPMKMEKTHLYFVPGMAAGSEIFRNISLPDTYEVHIIEWKIPEKGESLGAYAQRMAAEVKHPDAVLAGVSFGGVVAQEMNDYLHLKRLIIISSVKTRSELPRRMKWASLTGAYKLIPTSLVLSAEDLTKFSIGPKTKKRLSLYQEYLHVRDKQYLDWALEKMVTWDRKTPIPGLVHIHGDKDMVFPIKYIEDCEVIKNGTHIMILNKAREISKKLIAICEE